MKRNKQLDWIGCWTLAGLIVSVLSCELSSAESEWPHWRGPQENGVVLDGNPPLTWDSEKNVSWVAPLLGTGASTPIVVAERIYLLSAEETTLVADTPPQKHPEARTEPPKHVYRFWLTALELETGAELWRRLITEATPHEGHHRTNTYAGGSPVTDGKWLFFSLGSRGVYAFDLDGRRIWKRDLGKIRTRRGWGEASTLALRDGNLIIPWDQEDQSRLFNLNARDGTTQWQVLRDEPSNWSTPVFVSEAGRTLAVVNGSQRARAYSLDEGRSIWEVGTLSVNAIPTPVYDEDFVFCMSGYKKSVVYAVPRGSSGDLSDSEQLGWVATRDTPYVASPLLYEGRLYMTKGLGNRISILNPKTGQRFVEAEPLKGLSNVYASPIGVNGYVYIVDREGNTAVLKAGDSLDLVSLNRINDTVDASPVVVGDRLLLRSWNAVYCFREP